MKRLSLALAALLSALLPLQAQEKWPSRPIKLIVPFAAGGNTDSVARIAANRMQQVLGVGVVIENRGGAGGIIGADAVAKAAPDGYTFCVCSIGAITIAPATEPLPYDPLNDLAPISLINTNPLILLVHPSLQARSVQELIALARAAPNSLNYGSSGIGGLMYFSAELFKAKTGVKITHVPYRGGAPATAAVVAGQVQLAFTNMSDAVGQLEAGRVRALAVTTRERSPTAPAIPTLAESGVPGYHTESWNGLFAPKGTPQPILDRLAQLSADLAADPDVQKQMGTFGSVAIANRPTEFATMLREETALWAGLVREISKQ
ncbi:MAG: Bug family tripartite tricarboxylate transporter substrate binding protein [Xanthobacteraceae bacterium]